MSAIPTSIGAKTIEKDYFVRFSLSQRIEHIVLMLSFTALMLTGLPQKFHDAPVAGWIVLALGGIDSIRIIHRFFAALFVLEAVYHAGYVAYVLVVRRAYPSMLPLPKDMRDVLGMLNYYLGRSSRPPQVDRFDYRQKFEYWGVVWGAAIMIVTGLILVFPAQATRVLPGELVPAAKAAHGGEALLAFLVIIIWHLYGTHLSPDRFPIDTTIFAGKISRERMIQEHPLEYARLTKKAPGNAMESPEVVGGEPYVEEGSDEGQ